MNYVNLKIYLMTGKCNNSARAHVFNDIIWIIVRLNICIVRGNNVVEPTLWSTSRIAAISLFWRELKKTFRTRSKFVCEKKENCVLIMWNFLLCQSLLTGGTREFHISNIAADIQCRDFEFHISNIIATDICSFITSELPWLFFFSSLINPHFLILFEFCFISKFCFTLKLELWIIFSDFFFRTAFYLILLWSFILINMFQ